LRSSGPTGLEGCQSPGPMARRQRGRRGSVLECIEAGFVNHGYSEGRTLILENRYAAEEYERFNSNAAELVALNVDVLIAVARPAVVAAQRATSKIPIVFVVVPDPVGLKIVASPSGY